MKKAIMAGLVMALVSGAAMANVMEDFSGYNVGDNFTGVQSNWTSSSTDWGVSEFYGDHILVVGTADDVKLKYGAEEFNAATGYTVMMRMLAKYPYGSYSGLAYDMSADGSVFRRFFSDGLSGFSIDNWIYYQLYRSGDQVKVWMSSSPITADNPGSLQIDQTLAPLPGSGNYVGLYAAHTVYFDNVGIYQGDYIPEPATMGLLVLGGVFGLRRRG